MLTGSELAFEWNPYVGIPMLIVGLIVLVLVWLFGVLLSAAFAACLPRGAHWPLPSGLGGVVGDALLRMPAMLLGAPAFGLSRFVLGIILGLAALFAFAVAAGFVWRGPADRENAAAKEEDEEDEPEARSKKRNIEHKPTTTVTKDKPKGKGKTTVPVCGSL